MTQPRSRSGTAFEPADYAHHTQIKATYDSDNRFRVNHNIRPE
jgi:hypothetical protein